MAGYTRQSTYTDGDVIQASDSNVEFDAILAAFHRDTGHTHDGTAAEGAVIPMIGDSGIPTPLNKIAIDSNNDRLSFYVDVSAASVEQLRIEDGVAYPVTNDDVSLGTPVLMFKDGYFAGLLKSVDLQVSEIKSNDGTASGSIADGTGVFTIASAVLTTAEINGGSIDGTTIGGTTPAAATFTTLGITGDLSIGGTLSGRDVSADGTKLDGIEELADVTDTVNVEAAGALMDSELASEAAVKATTAAFLVADETKLDGIEALADVTDTANVAAAGALMEADVTNLSQVKAFDASDYQAFDADIVSDANYVATDENFTTADHDKLDGIEALADVTDTTNVEAAGALMDSEVDANLKTLVLPASTTISTFGASLVDDVDEETARTTLDVDQAGTALALAIALG